MKHNSYFLELDQLFSNLYLDGSRQNSKSNSRTKTITPLSHFYSDCHLNIFTRQLLILTQYLLVNVDIHKKELYIYILKKVFGWAHIFADNGMTYLGVQFEGI